jgi:signal transduction histidine kinase
LKLDTDKGCKIESQIEINDFIRKIFTNTVNEVSILIPSSNTIPKVQLHDINIFSVKEFAKNPNTKLRILIPLNYCPQDFLVGVHNESLQIRTYEDQDLEFNILLIIDKHHVYEVFFLDDNSLKIKPYGVKETQLTISLFKVLWESGKDIKNKESSKQIYMNLINVCAHELRSPLHSIVIQSDLLLDTTHDPEQLEMLQSIRDNTNRLSSIVDDLLEMSRIESNLLRLNKTKFNLNHLMDELALTYNRLISSDTLKQNSVILNFQYENIAFYLEADKVRLQQVLVNILNNAIRHTENGTINVVVKRYDKDHVLISVSDNGSGIQPEVVDKLFSKFNTTSSTGLGLGLYIAKNIIDLHKGKIWAVNNNPPANGCTFNILLPTIINQINDDIKILLVDDDEKFSSLLRNRLEELGYNTTILTTISRLENEYIYGYYSMIIISQVIESEDKNNTLRKIKSKDRIKICYLTKGKTNYDSLIGFYKTTKGEHYVNSNSDIDSIVRKIHIFYNS